MADAEYIVVCIDNSAKAYLRGNFEPQIDAVKHYCKTKLEANPKTEVTLFTMGSSDFSIRQHATSDLKKIVDSLSRITPSAGILWFKSTLSHGTTVGFCRCPPNKQKRMLFLVGSRVDLSDKDAKKHGSKLKGLGIAVDVVNFYPRKKAKNTNIPNQYGKMEVDAFVRFAKSNDNSSAEHLSSNSSIPQALSKSILRVSTFSTPSNRLHTCKECLTTLSPSSSHMVKYKRQEKGKKIYKVRGGEETGHYGHHFSHHPTGTSRKTNHHKKAKGKNHVPGDNKHVRSEAFSLENERVKLGKRKRICDV